MTMRQVVIGSLLMAATTMGNNVFGADTAASSAPATQAATTQEGTVPTRIKLWEAGKVPGIVEGKDTDTDPTEPTLDIYLPSAQTDTPDNAKHAGQSVLIFPGGGYVHLSTIREGRDVATMFNEHHITAFVLRYRHALRYHNPIPLEDAQRAIRLVRSKAAELHIDPNKVGILGFSAGGHLAASAATAIDKPDADAVDPIDKLSAHPDFAMLIYPVITFVDPSMHLGSRKALVGEDEEAWEAMSAEKRVTSATCPIFLVHSAVDTTVPVRNSILFFEACHENKVPVEMHIFPQGKHGFGLAPDNDVLKIWPSLAVHWMADLK